MFRHELVSALDAQRRDTGKSYLEFLRDETLSLGLYALRASEQATQQPHNEDEVYHVIEGKARFQCVDEDCDVGSGSVLFVKAGEKHRFHTIQKDLTVLVFFAPPEGSRRS